MKFFLLFAGGMLVFLSGSSQVAINTDGSLPNPNAILDLKSGSMGLLIPRMDSNSRKAMPNILGMVIYDSTTGSPWYNTGSLWVNLGSMGSGSGDGWSITGNSGTLDGTNFIGTTDDIPLTFRVNNVASGRIDPNKGIAFFGYQAGLNNTALDNSAFGTGALSFNTTGNFNSAVGYDALFMNTTGNNNSGTGYFSLGYNSMGNDNTANGYYSLFNNLTGSCNVAIGSHALFNNLATSDLVAIGDSALYNNTDIHNTAVGYQALYTNTTGGDNTAVGYGALRTNNTGSSITAVGAQTNGGQAGSFITLLGYSSSAVDGITDATAIGSNAQVRTSNSIQLGDNTITAVNSFGTFNTISDGRFKFNIREDVGGLDFIMRLRPVTYQLDTRKIGNELGVGYTPSMNIRRTGFIAQEVEKAADASGFEFDGVKKPQNDQDHYSLSYPEFVVPLVKAVQEQQKEIDELKKENEALKKAVTALLNNQTPGP